MAAIVAALVMVAMRISVLEAIVAQPSPSVIVVGAGMSGVYLNTSFQLC